MSAAVSQRWVIKVGTSSLTDADAGLKTAVIDDWARQISALRNDGIECILVSSGSIGAGMHRLGWSSRPSEIHRLQAAAAVGQTSLVKAYESAFRDFDIIIAQILLTHADLANRERYLNAKSTLRALLNEDVLPVVNENDTVVNDEIRFGDNDTLAALVCNLVEANLLVILTDQEGLYDRDPRLDHTARLITQVQADDPSILDYAGQPGGQGSGGMYTKVLAAQKAARSGASTVIASSAQSDLLVRLASGESIGTTLHRGNNRLTARKQWLAGQLRGNGRLILDDGAVRVLTEQGRSLLPIGVIGVEGEFSRGEIVTCTDQNGTEVARGLINYDASEARRIAGESSERIADILGYGGESEMIHRDNIAVTRR
ncbi:MAG: glutamate 5-kinase [Pseudomonadota bacterium]